MRRVLLALFDCLGSIQHGAVPSAHGHLVLPADGRAGANGWRRCEGVKRSLSGRLSPVMWWPAATRFLISSQKSMKECRHVMLVTGICMVLAISDQHSLACCVCWLLAHDHAHDV